jgi:tetratricopeptide (TPR) repeat protein/ribosomal protein S6
MSALLIETFGNGTTISMKAVDPLDPLETATFGELIAKHLRDGTRPAGHGESGKMWGRKDFAYKIGSTERAIRYWISGTSFPNDMNSIERELFGEDPNQQTAARRALRAARDKGKSSKSSKRKKSAHTEQTEALPVRGKTWKTEATHQLKKAEELHNEGKRSEGMTQMQEALAVAREEGNVAEEIEALIMLALSSSPRLGIGDLKFYFLEAEKRQKDITHPVIKAQFYRAKAVFLLDKNDHDGAVDAYKAAITACGDICEADLKANGHHVCVVRADYVHLLCSQKKFSEAQQMLAECDEYAQQNPEIADGSILQIAHGAGIHLAIERDNQEMAIDRIKALEALATNARLADRIGNDLLNVANQCSQRDAHEAALEAAQAAIRLGRRAKKREGPSFLVRAFYTEAMVLARSGEHASALSRAEAILDFCKKPEDATTKQATHHLIAEMKRLAGDTEVAIDFAQTALGEATGDIEEIAFAKLALARALADNGQIAEALKHAREGWQVVDDSRIPPKASLDFLSHIIDYASQLGMEQEAGEALIALGEISVNSDDDVQEVSRILRRAEAFTNMRDHIIEVGQGAGALEGDPALACQTVHDGNVEILKPLLTWWDEVQDAPPATIAGAYEFWGRGNFVRILENLRRFPQSLNVTLEVRSLNDIKRTIRMWGMYADVLILLWKGPTESAWDHVIIPMNTSLLGGHGYFVFPIKNEDESESARVIALGHGTTLPAEVALFLATEARSFIESGRLIVVPAAGAACFSPGHGVFEQLVAQAANAIPGIRTRTKLSSPIGAIPHSPDVPLPELFNLMETESDRLHQLRLLLQRRTLDFGATGEIVRDARLLELEIEDAIANATGPSVRVFSKRGFERATEPLALTQARFAQGGKQASSIDDKSAFAPLLVLQSLGYGWQVGLPDQNSADRRYEPQDNELVGTWLAPAESGCKLVFQKIKRDE